MALVMCARCGEHEVDSLFPALRVYKCSGGGPTHDDPAIVVEVDDFKLGRTYTVIDSQMAEELITRLHALMGW
jgi:hypothetical protein